MKVCRTVSLVIAVVISGVWIMSGSAGWAKYTAQAAQPGQPKLGQAFFTTKHGKEWSCASCHGTLPTAEGKHASTGKLIAPLAPAFNPKSFTDAAKTEKWFRRNCNDVVGRECSAAEKADVLAWLMSLKP